MRVYVERATIVDAVYWYGVLVRLMQIEDADVLQRA